MTNRIICCLAVSFAAGLLYGREQNVWLCLITVCFAVWRFLSVGKQQGRKAIPPAALHVILCIFVFWVGAEHYGRQQENFQKVQQYAQEQEYIQVQGKVYWKEEKTEQQQFIYYLKDAWIFNGRKWDSCGRIQVYSSTDSYEIGNCIQAEGQYEAFQLPRNEGNFNEEQYYYSKNIGLRITSYREWLLDGKEEKYKIWLLKIRKEMEQVFQENMSERTAGIMANMTLGSKNLADREVKALYQKAGISHVLAVSGLHVSIFGMGLYRILRRFYCPNVVASVLAIGIVYSFGMLTGMELSTTRAVIMFFMMMIAGIMRYTYDTVTALSVSAIIQLWENPFALWYAGFLFSYTAVLGAVVVTRVVKEATKKRSRGKILDTMQSSLCIQMATLPVSLFFYYEVPGYSVLVNGCVLPFMGILLFLGAAGGIVGLFQMEVSFFLLKFPTWILEKCEQICRLFAELPGNNIITGSPSVEKMIGYYVLMVFLLWMVYKRKKKRYLLTWIGLVVLLCCGNQQKGAEVDFLDVGQGDGIYLQSNQGNGVFIDGGSTDVGKVGTYRILPFLKYRGVKEIQIWFVSHVDEDHVSGLMEVLESGYSVKNIVFAEGIVRDKAWEKLVELAKSNGSSIYYVKAGESITLDEMCFTVLYPWEAGEERNESSMVLLAELEEMTVLFSGDIGEEQENVIVENLELQKYFTNAITIYKAAHHGSNTSNSLKFLQAISPNLTVVSCGENNSYGHPGENAVERIEQVGSKIAYTMKSGQIKIRKENGKTLLWKFQN